MISRITKAVNDNARQLLSNALETIFAALYKTVKGYQIAL
jgi:hypothetical protein